MVEIGATLWSLLEDKAFKRENGPMFIFPQRDVEVGYGPLRKNAGAIAKGLMALGVRRGEHVAIWSPNSPEWPAIVYGCAAAGTPLVMVNTSCRMLELEFALKQMDVAVLFIADNQGANDYIETVGNLCPEILEKPPGEWKSAKFPKLRHVIALGEKKLPGMLGLSDFMAVAETMDEASFADRAKRVDAEDTAFILFTSGTTGEPKGAMLSHQNFLTNVRSIMNRLQFTETDRLCLPLPLFHGFGMQMMIGAAHIGAPCVICEQNSVNQIFPAVRKTGATVLCGTPTMFIGWMEALESLKGEGSSLSKAVLGGASLYTETVNRMLTRTTVTEVWNLLGTTESLLVSGNKIDRNQTSKFISTGAPIESVEVKIADRDGRELKAGETGELLIRGPGVMGGYYHNPEATEKAIDLERWYHSGDMAVIDAGGNISIVGRIKEMLIRGGENIFPREIEEYLMSHPKVKEAQVVGIPSEYYGEEPVAFVILREGETATQIELKKYCKERIAYYKVPVYVYFVDTFPKTASGKVQKFKLKELALAKIQKKGDSDGKATNS